MTGARTYLVAYDIRSPRRLARVAMALTEAGYRLQYSVFALDLDEPARSGLVTRLEALIDPAEDDLRIYLVPDRVVGHWFGQLPGHGGITVSGSPAATLAERLKSRTPPF